MGWKTNLVVLGAAVAAIWYLWEHYLKQPAAGLGLGYPLKVTEVGGQPVPEQFFEPLPWVEPIMGLAKGVSQFTIGPFGTILGWAYKTEAV